MTVAMSAPPLVHRRAGLTPNVTPLKRGPQSSHQGPRHIPHQTQPTRRGAESCPEWELTRYPESEDPDMKPLNPQPINRKYRTGRRLMLAGVIMLALTHALGYLPTENPFNLPENWTRVSLFVPTWAWVIAWAAIIATALWELITGKGRKAISATAGMMLASAAGFLASYIHTVITVGWGSREWFFFGSYLFGALILLGLLVKIGALKQEAPEDDEE